MIFSDGSRTDSKIDQDDDDCMEKEVDPILLDGLRKVEVKYDKDSARAVGYKWTDKEDVVVLVTEDWDEEDLSSDRGFEIRTISIEQGERLIGFRSRQKGEKEGDFDVQFVKGIPK